MSEDQLLDTLRSDERRPEVVAFGIVLRRYRKQQGLTQEQISWQSGVDRKFISRIESGRREPALGTILKLASVLDVDLGEFMSAVATEINRKKTSSRITHRQKTSDQ